MLFLDNNIVILLPLVYCLAQPFQRFKNFHVMLCLIFTLQWIGENMYRVSSHSYTRDVFMRF